MLNIIPINSYDIPFSIAYGGKNGDIKDNENPHNVYPIISKEKTNKFFIDILKNNIY